MTRNRSRLGHFVCVIACSLFVIIPATSGLVLGRQDDTKPEKQSDESKPDEKKLATVKIENKPIRVFRTFDGRFESTQMSEIETDFESWSDLEISEIVEEGLAVSAGQVVLKFDTVKIDKAIAEAEFATRNAEFALEDAKLAMKEVSETFELENAIAQETWRNAKEDNEYYLKVLAPERIKDLDYDEKSAGYRLEYAKDELDQLEQMYTEDDLTEESEEIVLKRARRSVEAAERSQSRSMLQIQRTREVQIPRDDSQEDKKLKRAAMEFEKSQITLPIKKQKTEIALAKAEFDLKDKQKTLAELLEDRKKMTIVSPANGVLYYGRCLRGNWVGEAASNSRQMEIGKKLAANKIVMTVVDTNNMMIRADLDEKQLDSLVPRLKGKAQLNAISAVTVPVMVKSISRLPLDNNKFDCQVAVDDLKDVDVMPGMTCKMSFLIYENKDAVVAPKSSVFSDDGGISNYVFVVKDGNPAMEGVQLGRESGDLVEIVSGLSAGDEIAKTKP